MGFALKHIIDLNAFWFDSWFEYTFHLQIDLLLCFILDQARCTAYYIIFVMILGIVKHFHCILLKLLILAFPYMIYNINLDFILKENCTL